MTAIDKAALETAIEAAWENRAEVNYDTAGEIREAVEDTLEALDKGALRVAEPGEDGVWTVNQWAKKAVLLSFRLNDMTTIPGGPGEDTAWWDKVPSKFAGWDAARFADAGFRPAPPEMWQFLPICAQLPTVAQVSIIEPPST